LFLGTDGRKENRVARVSFVRERKVHDQPNGQSSSIFRIHAWKHDAIELECHEHRFSDQVDVVVTGAWRRRGRASGCVPHGIVAGESRDSIPELRPGAAQERFFDARFTHEGTQEVRTEGPQALPFTKR